MYNRTNDYVNRTKALVTLATLLGGTTVQGQTPSNEMLQNRAPAKNLSEPVSNEGGIPGRDLSEYFRQHRLELASPMTMTDAQIQDLSSRIERYIEKGKLSVAPYSEERTDAGNSQVVPQNNSGQNNSQTKRENWFKRNWDFFAWVGVGAAAGYGIGELTNYLRRDKGAIITIKSINVGPPN